MEKNEPLFLEINNDWTLEVNVWNQRRFQYERTSVQYNADCNVGGIEYRPENGFVMQSMHVYTYSKVITLFFMPPSVEQ